VKTFFLGAAAAALLHITPTVVLVKRQDAVARLLPGADNFAVRELHLSSADSRRLHDAVGWEPPDGVVTFYVGKHQGQVTGALIFIARGLPTWADRAGDWIRPARDHSRRGGHESDGRDEALDRRSAAGGTRQ